ISNPHTAPLAAPIAEPRPGEPEIAPPTAPLAAPTPAPTAVFFATLPALPLPSLAPADSAASLQASISCSASSVPTVFKWGFSYRIGRGPEQAVIIKAIHSAQAWSVLTRSSLLLVSGVT